MQVPAKPPDEGRRLAALHDAAVLDTPAEERFDRITRLARHLLDVPIALVSLVDEERQWFKSVDGLEVRETPRDVAFCAHAILSPEPLVVEDAHADPRFADNPLVVGEPGVRFYAGQPLLSPDGLPIGTLCAIDREPRKLSPELREQLALLARLAQSELATEGLSPAERQLMAQIGSGDHEKLVDPVTLAWSRAAIERMLARFLAHRVPGPGPEVSGVGVLWVGLPTTIADAMRREVCAELRRSLADFDVLGADPSPGFVVLVPDVDRADLAVRVAGVRRQLAQFPFTTGLNPSELTVGGAVGTPSAGPLAAVRLIELARRSAA